MVAQGVPWASDGDHKELEPYRTRGEGEDYWTENEWASTSVIMYLEYYFWAAAKILNGLQFFTSLASLSWDYLKVVSNNTIANENYVSFLTGPIIGSYFKMLA
mmetsp:Transcript_31708/g.48569  ORF Transcript_31708/g.48569 Transcript_31708/m.48569 type:complete len:103 (-) Transcript_31708:478-786(-)